MNTEQNVKMTYSSIIIMEGKPAVAVTFERGQDLAEGTIPFFMLTVGIGEVISCYVLGMILYKVLNNYRSVIFKNE